MVLDLCQYLRMSTRIELARNKHNYIPIIIHTFATTIYQSVIFVIFDGYFLEYLQNKCYINY